MHRIPLAEFMRDDAPKPGAGPVVSLVVGIVMWLAVFCFLFIRPIWQGRAKRSQADESSDPSPIAPS